MVVNKDRSPMGRCSIYRHPYWHWLWPMNGRWSLLPFDCLQIAGRCPLLLTGHSMCLVWRMHAILLGSGQLFKGLWHVCFWCYFLGWPRRFAGIILSSLLYGSVTQWGYNGCFLPVPSSVITEVLLYNTLNIVTSGHYSLSSIRT